MTGQDTDREIRRRDLRVSLFFCRASRSLVEGKSRAA